MKPVLFSLGPLAVYSFGFMVALGVFVSLYLMSRLRRKTGFPPSGQDTMDLVFVTVLAGFTGGRLLYLLQNWDWYLQHPLKVFAVWEGGLIFYGGVFGSLLGLFLFCRARKISYVKSLDFLLPHVALTQAFGRIGCFLNGCCYGKACNLPWAVGFPELPEAVHPAQLYEALFDFVLFFFLRAVYLKKKFDGQTLTLYFCLYAAGRFALEFLRADNPVLFFLTYNQWISVATFILALYFYKRAGSSQGTGNNPLPVP